MHLPKAIAALPKWADDCPMRYQLDCIRLRADGRKVYAEATDGTRMCRLTWDCISSDADYRLPAKPFARALRSVGVGPDGYFANLNGAVTVYGKKAGATVTPEEPEQWPPSEEVLYPDAGLDPVMLSARELRERARAALKAGEAGMTLKVNDVTTRLASKYVRDMAETAIQCGYDNVAASTKDDKSAVHFWADGELLFDAVIMPRFQD